MIFRTGIITKSEFIDKTIYNAVFSASIDGEEIDCGFQPCNTWEDAGKALVEWLTIPHDVDDLAVKMVNADFSYDPYNGAEYGECLKAVSEELQTIEGCRFLLGQYADLVAKL